MITKVDQFSRCDHGDYARMLTVIDQDQIGALARRDEAAIVQPESLSRRLRDQRPGIRELGGPVKGQDEGVSSSAGQ